MAIETVPFHKLHSQTNDMFEAVVVMAKRARQINQLRLLKFELPRITDNFEEFSSEDVSDDGVEYDEIEKVTTLALAEFLENKIQYTYVQRVEEEDTDFHVEI